MGVMVSRQRADKRTEYKVTQGPLTFVSLLNGEGKERV